MKSRPDGTKVVYARGDWTALATATDRRGATDSWEVFHPGRVRHRLPRRGNARPREDQRETSSTKRWMPASGRRRGLSLTKTRPEAAFHLGNCNDPAKSAERTHSDLRRV